MIPNAIPCVENQENQYVSQAIADGWIAVGPHIEKFENEVAGFVGAKHAVAVNSGTAALHLALIVAGVSSGDEVIVPSLTFAASANAVRHCGAFPMFVDSERESWGLDPAAVEQFLETACSRDRGQLVNRRTHRPVRAIMPVHIYGHPADMDRITALAERYGLAVVEDGAEALGAKYKGSKLGTESLFFCLSFNGNKIITCGGGGMVLTASADIATRVRYLSAQARDESSEFVHGTVGFNYRMPNINAAFGLGQMAMLGEALERKRSIAQRYRSELAGHNEIEFFGEADWAENSYWMSIIRLDPGRFPDGAPILRHHLKTNGIEARPVWMPLHLQEAFQDADRMPITVADEIHASCVCLPCSVGLTEDDQDSVIRQIRRHAEQ